MTKTRIAPNDMEAQRRYLEKYGVDTSQMTDGAVGVLYDKVMAAKPGSVQVLSRGKTVEAASKILSRVPEGYVGELKLEDDLEIGRARALGFEVFLDEKASVETPTGKSDGVVRLGDHILMIMPTEEYVAMHSNRDEALLSKRASRKRTKGKPSSGEVDPEFPVREL